jgi:hypothetical protein
MRIVAALLVCAAFSTKLDAQSPTTAKDPGVATVLSVLIPGSGQLYSENPAKGFSFMLGVAAAPLIGNQLRQKAEYKTEVIRVPISSTYPYGVRGMTIMTKDKNDTPLYVGIAAGVVLWVWNVIDAPITARSTNRRRASVAQRVQLRPIVGRENGVTALLSF